MMKCSSRGLANYFERAVHIDFDVRNDWVIPLSGEFGDAFEPREPDADEVDEADTLSNADNSLENGDGYLKGEDEHLEDADEHLKAEEKSFVVLNDSRWKIQDRFSPQLEAAKDRFQHNQANETRNPPALVTPPAEADMDIPQIPKWYKCQKAVENAQSLRAPDHCRRLESAVKRNVVGVTR